MLLKTERQKKQYKFWVGLLNKCNKKTELFSRISPSPTERFISKKVARGWFYFTLRSENRIQAGFNTLENNLFKFLKNKKRAEIESKFGSSLIWESDAPRERRICWECSNRFDEIEKWDTIQDQLVDAMARLENILIRYVS